MRRSRIPVLARIHSSEVSTSSANSELGMIRGGRYLPQPLMRTLRCLVKPAHDEGGVVAAEAQRVRQRGVDTLGARDVRHVIEIAVRVRVHLIDGWGQTALQDGLDADDRLDG